MTTPKPKTEARTQALLRERSARRRAMQLWIALTVIWGVVVGWVAFGFVNSVTDDTDVPFAWLVYAVPLAVLVVGSLLAVLRVRRTDRDLVALAEEDQRA
jgi:cytochrome bd-type quinol oxidase subunit 2